MRLNKTQQLALAYEDRMNQIDPAAVRTSDRKLAQNQVMFPKSYKTASKPSKQTLMGSTSLQKYSRAQIQFTKPFGKEKEKSAQVSKLARRQQLANTAPKKSKSGFRPPLMKKIGSDSSSTHQQQAMTHGPGSPKMGFQQQMAQMSSLKSLKQKVQRASNDGLMNLTHSEEEEIRERRAFVVRKSSSKTALTKQRSHEHIDNLSQLLLAKREDI